MQQGRRLCSSQTFVSSKLAASGAGRLRSGI